MVEPLVESEDVSIDRRGEGIGQTPLLPDAEGGSEGMAWLLLGRNDIDPNKYGKVSLTLPILGSLKRREGAVKIMLRREGICLGVSGKIAEKTALAD